MIPPAGRIIGSPCPDGQARQQAGVAEYATVDHANECEQQDALDDDNRGQDRQPDNECALHHGNKSCGQLLEAAVDDGIGCLPVDDELPSTENIGFDLEEWAVDGSVGIEGVGLALQFRILIQTTLPPPTVAP